MALFGMTIKRRTKRVGGFHAEYIDKGAMKRKPIGIIRTLGSTTSLLFGGFMCYVALHYIPAYLGLQKVIALSDLDTSAQRLAKNDEMAIVSSFLDPFRMKRTYLRPGQSVQAQYSLPAGATLDLHIKRCRPAFIVEIFECQVIGEESAKVTRDKVGTRRFKFQDAGFYMFEQKVTQPTAKEQKFRVVWSRA